MFNPFPPIFYKTIKWSLAYIFSNHTSSMKTAHVTQGTLEYKPRGFFLFPVVKKTIFGWEYQNVFFLSLFTFLKKRGVMLLL